MNNEFQSRFWRITVAASARGNYLKRALLFSILFIMSFYIAFSAHAGAQEKGLEQSIAEQVNLLKKKTNIPHQLGIKEFYSDITSSPWREGDRLTRKSKDIFKVLENSWTHGLNPENYHSVYLHEYFKKAKKADARFDVLLTDGLFRYLHDLSGARIDASGLIIDKTEKYAGIDAKALRSVVNQSNDMKKAIKAYEPQGKTYQALRKELIKLTEDADKGAAGANIDLNRTLYPGHANGAVPSLRKHFGLEKKNGNPLVYDDALVAAVMRFQRDHGLLSDGIVGSRTLHEMNLGNEQKRMQVIANLERLRWIDEKRPEKYVVVNIPSATLWAVDDHKIAFEMPVIVGSPFRKTRAFETKIEGVRLNPDWTVPFTIKKYDLWPKLKDDPEYFTEKGIEISRGRGADKRTLDPATLEWTTMSDAQLHKISMVQTPGPHNPLGKVRVLMTNKYNIYLHDTNKPEYFEEDDRAVSSGCIRMKYPEKMASFILKGQQAMSQDKIDLLMKENIKTDIKIDEPFPVYIVYMTTWLDDQGQIVYGIDKYRQDKKTIDKIKAIDGLPDPHHNAFLFADSSSGGMNTANESSPYNN